MDDAGLIRVVESEGIAVLKESSLFIAVPIDLEAPGATASKTGAVCSTGDETASAIAGWRTGSANRFLSTVGKALWSGLSDLIPVSVGCA